MVLVDIHNFHVDATSIASEVILSSEQLKLEIELLRSDLVPPQRDQFWNFDTSGIFAELWIVAEDSTDNIVFFDEEAGVYGLGKRGENGDLDTRNVRGNVVNVFSARYDV